MNGQRLRDNRTVSLSLCDFAGNFYTGLGIATATSYATSLANGDFKEANEDFLYPLKGQTTTSTNTKGIVGAMGGRAAITRVCMK